MQLKDIILYNLSCGEKTAFAFIENIYDYISNLNTDPFTLDLEMIDVNIFSLTLKFKREIYLELSIELNDNYKKATVKYKTKMLRDKNLNEILKNFINNIFEYINTQKILIKTDFKLSGTYSLASSLKAKFYYGYIINIFIILFLLYCIYSSNKIVTLIVLAPIILILSIFWYYSYFRLFLKFKLDSEQIILKSFNSEKIIPFSRIKYYRFKTHTTDNRYIFYTFNGSFTLKEREYHSNDERFEIETFIKRFDIKKRSKIFYEKLSVWSIVLILIIYFYIIVYLLDKYG